MENMGQAMQTGRNHLREQVVHTHTLKSELELMLYVSKTNGKIYDRKCALEVTHE